MGKIIAITSGKGGTGKSTVAVGLALAFARLEQRVLLIDLDAGLRCLDLMLGIDTQVVMDLSDILNGRPIRDAVYTAPNEENIDLIPAPIRYGEIVVPTFQKLLSSIGNSYDYIILDFPAGVDFSLYQALPKRAQILTVCNPDPVSVRDAAVVCSELPEMTTPPLFIINKFSADKIRNGIYDNIDSIIDASGFRLTGIVPERSELLLLSVHHALPPKSRGMKALTRIARRLNGETVLLPNPKRI